MSEVIKSNETVYFFEYLDNSIAYVLKKKNIISAYINDIHGIAPIEFEMQIALPSDVKRKLLNHFKYLSACMLDKKVFNYGDGFIYASNEMKKYYEKTTLKSHQSKPYVIIPYLLDFVECSDKLDLELKNALKEQFQIQQDDFVFMFAGGYKRTAGVDDLIIAFKQLSLAYKNIKLILIGKEGDSYTYENCRKLACDSDKNIFFIDSIPYEKLYTYQNIANVVICPDKMNPYSNIIVHVKYLDALASGKLVINGSFESVMEINKNNFLSLTFEPSNIDSLRETMKNCIDNYNSLIIKYKDTEKYTRKNLTYSSYIDVLINNNNGS